MSEDVLDPDLRALLDLGRDQLGPDPETIARLRGKVETAVMVAGAGVGVAGLAKTVAVKTLAVKLAVVASVAIATGAVVHVVQVARHEPAPVVSPVVSAPPAKPHVVVTPLPAAPEPPQVTLEPPVAAPPAAVTAGSSAPVAPPPRPRAPVKVPEPPRATLARETELVDLATRALRDGDFAAVHAAVTTYTRETGGAGQLAEEIDAVEVEALCRAHDDTATHKLAAFDARWPHAGQRHRLSAACQGDQ
jgi:hypothetical protein